MGDQRALIHTKNLKETPEASLIKYRIFK